MKRLRYASLGCALALLVTITGGGTASASLNDWAPIHAISIGSGLGSGGTLINVSCAGNGACTAVGQDANGQPMAVTESDGTWAAPLEITLPAGFGSGTLYGVSCTAPGECVAVGHDDNGAIGVIQSGGSWGTPVEVSGADGLVAISCLSAGCTAVGSQGDVPVVKSESGGTWSAVPLPAGPPNLSSAGFSGVSCVPSGDCTAVGTAWDNIASANVLIASTEQAGMWNPPVKVSTGNPYVITSVSCTSAGNCIAAGEDDTGAAVWDQVNSMWTTHEQIASASSGQLGGISCSSAGNCTAAGLDGNFNPIETVESGGTWGPAHAFTLDVSYGGGYFNQVSCVSVGNCTAVGAGFNNQSFYVQPQSDLGTTVTGPATGKVGAQLTYKAMILNSGDTATRAKLTLTPSHPVKLISATGPGCVPGGGGSVTCTSHLGVGGSFTVKYLVAAATSGGLSVTATSASADQYVDPASGNDQAVKSTAVANAANTVYTSVSDDGFPVSTLTVGLGKTLFWNNLGPSDNELLDTTGLGLFDLTVGAPVDFVSRPFWGAGKFTVMNTQNGDEETVSVPMIVSPATGSTSTDFTVDWGSLPSPTGYSFQVQVLRPGSTAWRTIATGSDPDGDFVPASGPGTYKFRARVLQTGTANASAWSATRTITVS